MTRPDNERSANRQSDMAAGAEQGFIMIMTLLVLVVLTVVCLSTLDNSTIEVQIAGNDKVHSLAFNVADGGVLSALSLLDNTINPIADFAKDAPITYVGIDPLLAGNDYNDFFRRAKGFIPPRTDDNFDYCLGDCNPAAFGDRVYFRVEDHKVKNSPGDSVESHMGSSGQQFKKGKSVHMQFAVRGVSASARAGRDANVNIEGRYVLKP